MTQKRGGGSLRERRPGVWEVRVALGPDLLSGRSRVRSITVHGDRAVAESARARWAAKAELVRGSGRARPAITVAQLLAEWLIAEHGWRPSTIAGYRSVVGFFGADPVGARRAVEVSPPVLEAVCTHWRRCGWPEPTIWARMRVLRSALGWAYAMRIIDVNPLDGMRSPPQAGVRMHAPVEHVIDLLDYAAEQLDDARRVHPGDSPEIHRAEQVLLLVRLAADTGARRGELAALRIDDLDGDVLTIARAASNEVIGPTKSGRIRRLTVGATAAGLWRDTVSGWNARTAGRAGPWLFSAWPDHGVRLTTSCLAHWFGQLCADACHPDITLHRLRHSVATALVSRGDLLQAQYRLGHRDAATTLRIYSHVMPLTDQDAAATLNEFYRS